MQWRKSIKNELVSQGKPTWEIHIDSSINHLHAVQMKQLSFDENFELAFYSFVVGMHVNILYE